MTKVLFVGSKHLGLECLKTVLRVAPGSVQGIVTLDDRSDSRTEYDGFQALARESGLACRIARDRADSEALILQFRTDLCLLVGWYWLLSTSMLEAVPRGCLGIHPSLLPKYRGGAALVWAIINGDTQTGVSLFSLTNGMDDGDIWAQRSVSVGPHDYVADVLRKVESEALAMLEERWNSILRGTATAIPQDDSQATFASLRLPTDGEIDWRLSATKVYNFIRAQSTPYPGAFSYLTNGEKVTIRRARPVDVRYYGRPGQVAQIRPDGVYVVCGDNRPLLVEEVEKDGGGGMPANTVLRSLAGRFR